MGGRFNALNGEPLVSPFGTGPPPGTRGGGKSYTADRTATRDLLLRGLDGEVSFGKRCVGYEVSEEGVTAFFEDGSHAPGAFLVGAEGVRSVVRKQYLPKLKILDTDCRCIYGKTKISKELLERTSDALLKGLTVLVDGSRGSSLILLFEAIKFQDNDLRSELPDDYVYWVLGSIKEDFEKPDHELLHLSGPEVADLTLKITEKWLPSLRAVLELQERDMTSALRISMASPDMAAWESSGKVALIGDAAHVMPPTGGVGANIAMQDAAALFKVLSTGISRETISGYEEELRRRGREAILGSARGGKHLLGMRDWETFEAYEP